MSSGDLAASYMIAFILAFMVSTFITPALANRFGKKNLFIGVMLTTSIIISFIFTAGPTDSILFFALGVVGGLIAGVTPILCFTMFGDAADYSEYRNHRRASGLVFSAGTMAMKSGSGLATAVMLLVLYTYGYYGNVADTIQSAINGIKMDMCHVPTLFIIVAIGSMFYDPLSKQKMLEIEA
jgi:glycoside/pentoside/hexuronide:cation symporter, GPH family